MPPVTAQKQPPLVVDLETKPAGESLAPARSLAPSADAIVMFERLATDPNVDVTKLERLIEMQERILRHQAKAEFDAAFSEMQGELPVIDERGAIMVDSKVRSNYAKYEDIQAAIRPVLQRHGFAIRHRNEAMPDGRLRIVGVLSHRGGHSEQDEFICPADKSGGKADIQAIGSTRSYGMRYTTISLLNIETRGVDDDGRKAATLSQEPKKVPAGYDDWLTDMSAAADEGWPKLSKAFAASKEEYRKHLTGPDKDKWKALRAKAEKVQVSA